MFKKKFLKAKKIKDMKKVSDIQIMVETEPYKYGKGSTPEEIWKMFNDAMAKQNAKIKEKIDYVNTLLNDYAKNNPKPDYELDIIPNIFIEMAKWLDKHKEQVE